ncbi:hypothetical protein V2J09_018942 [Rumex salicifolius]
MTRKIRTHSSCVVLLLFFTFLAAAVSAARTPAYFASDDFQKESHDVVTPFIRLQSNSSSPKVNSSSSNSSTCDQTYGFMPCTSTWIGNLFLILVYGYLMYLAATYLSSGSELLLEILGPGIVGGLFLPVLGALPDALLILVSGLSGDSTTAQSQVSVGMGLLAGSTVMLLTVIWGTCVIVGKCDIQGPVATDGSDTKGFSLTESGVSTDIWTSYAARIMAVSVAPFLVVQLPQAMKSTSGRHLAVLIALVLSLALLVGYCVYQIVQPWIQKRRIEYAKHKKLVSGFLTHLKRHALGRLTDDQGRPRPHVLERLFSKIDVDKDNYLVPAELRAFLLGAELEEMNLDHDDVVEKVMKEFDTEADAKITFNEFARGITKWLADLNTGESRPGGSNPNTAKHLNDVHRESTVEHDLLGAEGEDNTEEGDAVVENPKKIVIKAVLMLLFGTVIAAMFADPLVDAVDNFSDATSIPSFFISFIFLPLATNSSEAVSAIIFASRKKRKTASLTFSELYGAVTMNNVLCLSVFLALVYIRGLTWDFSSEVLVILIVCVVMGVLGSFRTTFPLWTSILAFALYPFSLLLVYILDYKVGSIELLLGINGVPLSIQSGNEAKKLRLCKGNIKIEWRKVERNKLEDWDVMLGIEQASISKWNGFVEGGSIWKFEIIVEFIRGMFIYTIQNGFGLSMGFWEEEMEVGEGEVKGTEGGDWLDGKEILMPKSTNSVQERAGHHFLGARNQS